jgi:iduronate 2-sulfatase
MKTPLGLFGLGVAALALHPLFRTVPAASAAPSVPVPATQNNAASVPAPTAPAQRPNVLFISVDDLRPELGSYGNTIVKTPNMDRLAARGVTFTRAYCQQAVCSPSRTSLLTGRRPDATQVWDLETHFRVALPDAVTLPQQFRANGYHTAALSKIYHHGFEDGRSWSEPHWYPGGQTVDTDPADWRRRVVKRYGPGVTEFFPPAGVTSAGPKRAAFEMSTRAEDDLPDGFTAAEAVKRLHALKEKNQPFFLAVGFLKPHLPFVAPKKYWDLYDPTKIPTPSTDRLPDGAPEFAGHSSGELHTYANVPAGNPIPPEFARTLRHGYYASISYTDAQVGRVLDALDREGLAKNTIVVLWGDHGWHLGDHGLWNKHSNFELAARSPLIVAAPGAPSAGKKSAALVEFVDVYPTLCDLAGLTAPKELDGVSLRPLLANPNGSVKKIAVSQYSRGGAQTGNQPLMGYSARDERWRLTLWRNRRDGSIAATELYDEQNDPNETTNVASSHKDVVTRLSAELAPFFRNAPPVTQKPNPRREAMFQGRDKDRDGKLTREEFLANQPDPDEAPKRFIAFDTNKDGVLSKEEFVTMGGVQTAPPKR